MVSFGNLPNRVGEPTSILFRGAKVAGSVALMQESQSIKFLIIHTQAKSPQLEELRAFI